jgi:hypothetical protein
MQHFSVTWQSYDSLYTHEGFNLDDLGGSFSFEAGMRWPDYLAGYDAAWHPYVEAIRHAIVEGAVWAAGDWHQHSAEGAPVVAGGHFMQCSFRSWGDLLAAVWSSELNRDFSYLDFYVTSRLAPSPFG